MTMSLTPAVSWRRDSAWTTRINLVGLLLVACVTGGGCGAGVNTGHRDAIRRVRAEMAATATQRDPRSRLASLKAIDLTGVPGDYKACFRMYVGFVEDGNVPRYVSAALASLDQLAVKYRALETAEFKPDPSLYEASDSD